jgi:hypothetical protein
MSDTSEFFEEINSTQYGNIFASKNFKKELFTQAATNPSSQSFVVCNSLFLGKIASPKQFLCNVNY